MRPIILTADDFGFSVEINEAVEIAHRDGVLSAASLMVTAPAAEDAIERARRNSRLRVGLHLTLVQGSSALPPEEIPHLVGPDGRFPQALATTAARWFFQSSTRAELAKEITAQFAAFRATGLKLDHVNAHNHMHLHPSVLTEIIANLGAWECRNVRLPMEPLRSPKGHWSIKSAATKFASFAFLTPWLWLMRWRLRHASIRCNDWLLGLSDTGQVDEACLMSFLDDLPAGIAEIYFHPASKTTAAIQAAMPGYRNEDEFAALLSSEVRCKMQNLAVRPVGYSDLGSPQLDGSDQKIGRNQQ